MTIADQLTRARGSTAVLGVAIFVAWATINSFNSVLSKVLLSAGLEAVDLVTLRTMGCTLVLAVLLAASAPRLLRLPERAWGGAAAYGVIGVAFTSGAYFVAISRIPIGIALLLQYTAPLLVALWVRFVRGTPVQIRVWKGHATCLVGLSLTALPAMTGALDVWGVVAALASGAGFAASFLLLEHGVRTRHPFTQLLWGYGFASVAWMVVNPPTRLPWETISGSSRLPATLGSFVVPTAVVLVAIVMVGTVLTSTLMVYGVRLLGSARAGILGVMEPVISIAVAWLVLSEILSGLQLLGAGIALAGVLVAETAVVAVKIGEAAAPPLPVAR